MRFGVLGPLDVATDHGDAVSIPESLVRALLADLIAHVGVPVSTDRLIDDLWPGSTPTNPTRSLHTKVSQLRRALEDAEPGGRKYIVTTPAGYLLRAEPAHLDSTLFLDSVARAQVSMDLRMRANLLREALALWRGPAFADFVDLPFSAEASARLDEARIAARSELAEVRLELGEHRMLIEEINELVREHPLRERLRSIQMRALYRCGRAADALDSFNELRTLLAETRGADPSRELVELHRAILEQDAELRPEPISLGGKALGHNLPEPPNALIGRDSAVQEVTARMGSDRLVTLVGPGGVGKSRLALAVASSMVDSFADGIWLVEFDALDRSHGPEVLADAVLSVLSIDVNAPPGPPPQARLNSVDRVVAFLRSRRAMLVLDNCEHVVDAAAALVEAILAESADCRILATSRSPLAVRGETIRSVEPLELPAADTSRPELLSASSAAQLFAARAPGLRFDAANFEDVIAICRRLDGIPLALELAATKVRVLGVHELLIQLDRRFQILAGGFRDSPDRHRTLRAAIDWSWELLSGAERDVLCWLAIHAEDCSLPAALSLAGDPAEDHEILGALTRLVDQSLVVMQEAQHGPRYRLLESIAAYCVEHLETAEVLVELRLQHANHYAELGERAGAELRGPDQRRWLEWLDVESPNIRKAADFAIGRRDARLAMRLVNSLIWFGFLRGRLTEAHRYLRAVSAMAGELRPVERATILRWQAGMALLIGEADQLVSPSPALTGDETAAELCALARGEWFLGYAQWYSGALPESEDRVGRALATFRSLDDSWGIAASLSLRAAQGTARSELAVVRDHAETSAAIFDEVGDRWGRLKAIEALAVLAEFEGRYDDANDLHYEGLQIVEDLGLWTETAHKLALLGRIALLRGEFATADELHHRSLRLAVSHANRLGEGFAEIGLGLSARRQGRLDDAEQHLTRWLGWLAAIAAHNGVALVLAELGFIAELRGDAEAAWALHAESLSAASATGDIRAVALAVEGLAGAAALADQFDRAARLLGAAMRARASTGAPLASGERMDVERITAAVREALGDERFAAEFQRGGPVIVDDHGVSVTDFARTVADRQIRRIIIDAVMGRPPPLTGGAPFSDRTPPVADSVRLL
ncbi:BTAD domain-containing putative transcriptional regulator [Nocardia sp. NPDC051787]|uniref:BTAD domain-containing putative transcriptional regulator n=1 Tax=Nocardia sp. NPDC051787 TaxID=3155415 RepID=UPI00343C820B